MKLTRLEVEGRQIPETAMSALQRYMPTFLKAAGTREQWAGMREDSAEGKWYEREEVDPLIAQLTRERDEARQDIANYCGNGAAVVLEYAALRREICEGKASITELCDRLERIQRLTLDPNLDPEAALTQIREWSGGFAPMPEGG